MKNPKLTDYKYEIVKKAKDVGDVLIQKTGYLGVFSLKDSELQARQLKKSITDSEASCKPFEMNIRNVQQHHPDIVKIYESLSPERQSHLKFFMANIIKLDKEKTSVARYRKELKALEKETAHVRKTLKLG